MRITIYFLLFLLSAINLFSQDIYMDRIIVKFKSYSNIGIKWQQNNREMSISEFDYLLGDNKAVPFIGDNLLQSVRRNQNNFMKSTLGGKTDNLEMIAVIYYNADVSPIFAAAKISTMPEIEYAEAIPIRKIVSLPNDRRLSEQYYYSMINADFAWQQRADLDTVVVAIIDTGVELAHNDLSNNIFYNKGEIGLDENGNDKRFNGIDDDGNGFIDDWVGWDFGSVEGDNMPTPGHWHGTHVAGICGAVTNNSIGIAGVAPNVKIMAIKIAIDDVESTTVVNTSEALLYAAANGAEIINCSWGGMVYSKAEEEVVEKVIEMGVLIIAAAGNDGLNIDIYPAAYKGVISVAATDHKDKLTYFSNYSISVDVTAPGSSILSTYSNNSYFIANGTSMSTPIASAVAAIIKGKFPKMNSQQVGEILKMSSTNIDNNNIQHKGLIGVGRVSVKNALDGFKYKSLQIQSIKINDEIPDSRFQSGELINLDFVIQNMLSDANNISVALDVNNPHYVSMIRDSISIGSMKEMESLFFSEAFEFKLNDDIPTNANLQMIFRIYLDGTFLSQNIFLVSINPAYQNMTGNNIHTTFNNIGNIGFNDFPSNLEGIGFRYKGSDNLLFESSLMLSISNKQIFNTARSESVAIKDKSFVSDKLFFVSQPGSIANTEGTTQFKAYNEQNTYENIDISQKVFQFVESELNDVIFTAYTIHNKKESKLDSLFLGLFLDWDIHRKNYNKIWWETTNQIAFCKYPYSDTIPMVAVVVLSDYPKNCFAFDNNGKTYDNPGLNDGFTKSEKIRTLTGGINRHSSSITDCSMIVSAGPFSVKKNDSANVAFAIIAGYSEEELKSKASFARFFADNYGINSSNKAKSDNIIKSVFPNPANNQFDLIIISHKSDIYDISIFDSNGKKTHTLSKNIHLEAGKHNLNYLVNNLADGMYYIVVSNSDDVFSYPIVFHKK